MAESDYLRAVEDMEGHYRPCACRSGTPFFNVRLADNEHSHKTTRSGKLYRTLYQHDRDTILYSASFRRLKWKTQIFPEHTADQLRTRLDHTLEVAQISRHLARQLRLNEDLVDAIALAHDIGHTPFAHSGERALHQYLRRKGKDLGAEVDGFKHNWQSLRVVDKLERSYPELNGLNLTRAVRLGILKHTTLHYPAPHEHEPCSCDMTIELESDFDPNDPSTDLLEVQLVHVADDFAQAVHDFEDALVSDSMSLEEIVRNPQEYGILKSCLEEIEKRGLKVDKLKLERGEHRDCLVARLRSELIFQLTIDCISSSSARIEAWEKENFGGPLADGIKMFNYHTETNKHFPNLIALDKLREPFDGFKRMLLQKVVQSERVSRMDGKSEFLLRRILDIYLEKPLQAHDHVLHDYERAKETLGDTEIRQKSRDELPAILNEMRNDPLFLRVAVDYVAGMTDRYAIREFDQLYSAYPRADL